MKNCSWYLWLNGRKIFNIRQLRENFDTTLLTGYFLGESLMKWLSDLGEYEILKRLSTVDRYGDVGKQLEFAFGVSPDPKPAAAETEPAPELSVTEITVPAEEVSPETPVFTASLPASSFGALFAGSYPGLAESSFAAVTESSFISLLQSSFTGAVESSFASIVGNAFAQTFTSSYNFSSYAAFVSGQALNIASSANFGSFGSFASMFGKLGFGMSGSFSFSSFTLGSFGLLYGKLGGYGLSSGGSYAGSFGAFLNALMKLMRGGSFGSFGSFGNIEMFTGTGSFRYSPTGAVITAEEYHRTLINLSSCPLNAYGYGINLV